MEAELENKRTEEFAEEGIDGVGRCFLFAEDATYAIMYITDVQVDLNNSLQAEEFNSLEQTIREIQIVLYGGMEEVSMNNYEGYVTGGEK